jgi:hypothetical protein
MDKEKFGQLSNGALLLNYFADLLQAISKLSLGPASLSEANFNSSKYFSMSVV